MRAKLDPAIIKCELRGPVVFRTMLQLNTVRCNFLVPGSQDKHTKFALHPWIISTKKVSKTEKQNDLMARSSSIVSFGYLQDYDGH